MAAPPFSQDFFRVWAPQRKEHTGSKVLSSPSMPLVSTFTLQFTPLTIRKVIFLFPDETSPVFFYGNAFMTGDSVI